MSTVEYNIDLGGFQTPPPVVPSVPTSPAKSLHRIGQVRQEQGVSVRSVARRLIDSDIKRLLVSGNQLRIDVRPDRLTDREYRVGLRPRLNAGKEECWPHDVSQRRNLGDDLLRVGVGFARSTNE